MTDDRGIRIRKWECGLRPIGAYAYAPVGRCEVRKVGSCEARKLKAEWQKAWGRGQREEEGSWEAESHISSKLIAQRRVFDRWGCEVRGKMA